MLTLAIRIVGKHTIAHVTYTIHVVIANFSSDHIVELANCLSVV